MQTIHFHEPLIILLDLHQLRKKLGTKTISCYHANFSLVKVNSFPINAIFSKFLDKQPQFYFLSKSDFLTAQSPIAAKNFYQLEKLVKTYQKILQY